MANIQITSQFDVKDIAQNINDYRFQSPLSLADFTELFENMNPNQYRALSWQDVLEQVQEPIPDNIIEVLVSSGLYYNDFIYQSTLTPTMVKKLITSGEDFERTGLIARQKLSTAQFKTLISTTEFFDTEELADAITEANNPEYAKFVVKEWASIPALESQDLSHFQYHLFIGFGSTILSDNDSRKIFGKVRPTMSSEELRSHEPCPDGWRRCVKWAGRNDTAYTWNEFIAQHVLSSIDNVDNAKSDLEWLAESVADTHEWVDWSDL